MPVGVRNLRSNIPGKQKIPTFGDGDEGVRSMDKCDRFFAEPTINNANNATTITEYPFVVCDHYRCFSRFLDLTGDHLHNLCTTSGVEAGCGFVDQ
jgi:hypothetical protein